jgi:hypothetical protein
VGDFKRLTARSKVRALWPPASKLDALIDLECLRDLSMIGFFLRCSPTRPSTSRGFTRSHGSDAANYAPAERRRVAGAIQQIAVKRVQSAVDLRYCAFAILETTADARVQCCPRRVDHGYRSRTACAACLIALAHDVIVAGQHSQIHRGVVEWPLN